MAKKVDLKKLHQQAQVLANGLETHQRGLEEKGEAQDLILNIKDLVTRLRCAPQSVHWPAAVVQAPRRPPRRAPKGKGGKRV